MRLWKRIGDALTSEVRFKTAVMIRLHRIESRLADPSSAELREEVARLQYLLARYEENEEEEDALEKIPIPVAVVVIFGPLRYQPMVRGPFPTRQAATEWANAYEPQVGEVVHVLETEQP